MSWEDTITPLQNTRILLITSTFNLTISCLTALTRLAHHKQRKRLSWLGQWAIKPTANSRNKTSALTPILDN